MFNSSTIDPEEVAVGHPELFSVFTTLEWLERFETSDVELLNG
jgi:hypothetical protein